MIGCKNDSSFKVINIKQQPSSIPLTGQIIAVDDTIKFPKWCGVTDSHFMILDPTAKEFLRIYSLPSFQLTKTYGVIGNGPHEYSPNPGPSSSDLRLNTHNGRQGLWIRVAKEMVFVDLDSLLSEPEYLPSITKYINPSIIPTNQLFLVNDSIAIGNGSTPGQQLFLWNMKNDSVHTNTFYPKIEADISRVAEIYQNSIFGAPMAQKGDMAVYAYEHFKIIDFVSINNLQPILRLKFDEVNKKQIRLSEQGIPWEEQVLIFMRIITGEKHFYALFWGVTEAQIEGDDSNTPWVYQIDYEGNIKAIFKLDQQVNSICISPDEQYLYGTTPMLEVNTPIVKYELPRLGIN